MRLAHLTDAHLGPVNRPPLVELIGKRIVGYTNWRRKRGFIHLREIADRVVGDLGRQGVDHIAVTGDLVNIGASAEWPRSRDWLERLGSPETVSVVPGNHDVYVPGIMPAVREAWQAYITGDRPNGPIRDIDPHDGFPYLRERGDVALIGCSSGVPTGLHKATGRLGPAQCARLADILRDTGARGLCRIVLIHHPPLPQLTTMFRGLDDAAAFCDVLARAGAELVLHGHNHTATLASTPGPDRAIPIVGTGSASVDPGSKYEPGQYSMIDIDRNGAGFDLKLTRRAATATDMAVIDERMLAEVEQAPMVEPLEPGSEPPPHLESI